MSCLPVNTVICLYGSLDAEFGTFFFDLLPFFKKRTACQQQIGIFEWRIPVMGMGQGRFRFH